MNDHPDTSRGHPTRAPHVSRPENTERDMNSAPTYDRDVLDLLDRAGIPTTCPPMLRPGDIERVLNLTPDRRLALENAGWLEPTSRTKGGERRYSQADLAHAILVYGLRTYWNELEPDDS